MVCIHKKRLRKCPSKKKGIEKVEVDANSQNVIVTGYVHQEKILKAIKRGGLKADFWLPKMSSFFVLLYIVREVEVRLTPVILDL
ncbi:hypothetical protein CFOL_v3_08627 [Cephalotus follicularis]|uniref:HMA domain-containing protein n=1 Tax=Cephalotus follicularis TaxID=3775 RepID=A0A1Q3BBC7_CEPFO|nr:hypothetical protein CFOL_v3_08627 [Cephalotus follicularis]